MTERKFVTIGYTHPEPAAYYLCGLNPYGEPVTCRSEESALSCSPETAERMRRRLARDGYDVAVVDAPASRQR